VNGVLQLGPITLPFALLMSFGAIGAGSLVSNRLGKRFGIDSDPAFFWLLLVSAVASRLAFVWRFREVYGAAPFDVIDIRDGGWSLLAGTVAAWGGFLVFTSRRKALRKPLGGALSVATAILLAGNTLLAAWPAPASEIPSFSLNSVEGQVVPLSSFRGKPLVVNLWATWCPPCQREMPMLGNAQTRRPDIHFVFLNQGDGAETVRHFLALRNPALRNVLLDAHGQLAGMLGHHALPTTLFFDARGRLIDTRIGELSRATLEERLDALTPPSTRPGLP
jgi:thiol-disulfide isomerase/thioredoxin